MQICIGIVGTRLGTVRSILGSIRFLRGKVPRLVYAVVIFEYVDRTRHRGVDGRPVGHGGVTGIVCSTVVVVL